MNNFIGTRILILDCVKAINGDIYPSSVAETRSYAYSQLKLIFISKGYVLYLD